MLFLHCLVVLDRVQLRVSRWIPHWLASCLGVRLNLRAFDFVILVGIEPGLTVSSLR